MSAPELLAAPPPLTLDLILIAADTALEVAPVSLIHICRQHWSEAKVLLLVDPVMKPHLSTCLAASTAGLFPLHLEATALVSAVRATLTYGLVLHPQVLSLLRPSLPHPVATSSLELTDLQRHLLHLLAAGATNAQIATALCLAESTVVKHISRLLQTLDAPNRTVAVAQALRWELIQ